MDEKSEKTQTQPHASILDAVLRQHQVDTLEAPIDQRLKALLMVLPDRDREIIESHFGLFNVPFATLEEIGKRFSITRERVRQIERSSIQVLRKSSEFDKHIRPFEDSVVQILETSGGAMEEHQLFREALGLRWTDLGQIPQFLFAELLGRVERIRPNKLERSGWRLKLSSWEFIEQTIGAFEEVMKTAGQPLTEDEFFAAIRGSAYFVRHEAVLTPKVIEAILGLSQSVCKNPFGLWGLSAWPEIVPKRMSDKIYLVMKKTDKPMHFREIARAINEFRFDHKVAHPATIHNELIVNRKYVLIGRGIYALAQWGYEPGVVAEVIAKILDEAQKPLVRQKIVVEVLKRRNVKTATIHLALTDRSKFQKLPTGEYARIPSAANGTQIVSQ